MGLGGALVDRARPVRRADAGLRVEGRTQYGEAKGPWFRCRLELPAAGEQGTAPTGVRPVLTEPTLMYEPRDEEGDELHLTNQERVEVASKELGHELWEFDRRPAADPQAADADRLAGAAPAARRPRGRALMGYRGAKLANVFDSDPADLATRAIAEDTAEFMLSAVVELTPVDTGHLKSSWEKSPTHRFVDFLVRHGWEGGVETSVSYAPFVEWGTGLWGPKHAKYPIRPKKPDGWLHWVDDAGDDHFAKLVMHPGSEGQHMAALAVAHTDSAFGFIGEPGTLLWRQEQTKVWDKEAARARIRGEARVRGTRDALRSTKRYLDLVLNSGPPPLGEVWWAPWDEPELALRWTHRGVAPGALEVDAAAWRWLKTSPRGADEVVFGAGGRRWGRSRLVWDPTDELAQLGLPTAGDPIDEPGGLPAPSEQPWEVALWAERGTFDFPFCRVMLLTGASTSGPALYYEVTQPMAIECYPTPADDPEESIDRATAVQDTLIEGFRGRGVDEGRPLRVPLYDYDLVPVTEGVSQSRNASDYMRVEDFAPRILPSLEDARHQRVVADLRLSWRKSARLEEMPTRGLVAGEPVAGGKGERVVESVAVEIEAE